MKIIIGIDPGKNTGVAIFKLGLNLELLKTFNLRCNEYEIETYINILDEEIKPYLDGISNLEIGYTAIEDQYSGKNADSFKKIIISRCFLESWFYNNYGVFCNKIYPKTWQSWLGINPRTKRAGVKKQAQLYAKTHYPNIKINQDVADAVIIGLCGFHKKYKQFKYQR